MSHIPLDRAPQLLGIAKKGEGAVNQSNDFAERDFRGRTSQTISSLRSPHAFHDAGVLKLPQYQLKELQRKVAF
jgi:hypothetical protein